MNLNPQTINIFVLRKGFYEAVISTKDDISRSHEEKLTLELESAKPWKRGLHSGQFGSFSAPNEEIPKYNDDDYYFLNIKDILGEKKPIYLALEKQHVEDGGEHFASDIRSSLGNHRSRMLLFVD
ncbi:MAG: hypothetical protein JWM20_889 [Patescibacteria group bacterium]|nr:hypothetical protein [Patescibacteria group bacterium]